MRLLSGYRAGQRAGVLHAVRVLRDAADGMESRGRDSLKITIFGYRHLADCLEMGTEAAEALREASEAAYRDA